MDKQYMEMNQKELTDYLAKLSYAYYVQDAPLVEDSVYDELYDMLTLMETNSGIVYGNSPTYKVQGECVPYLKKVKHPKPMLSCAKTKDLGEIKRFYDKGDFYHAYASIKLDGLTLCLTYENSELVQAVTRGNGVEGEDVTHNARWIKNLPKHISTPEHIELRGECVIRNDDFVDVCKVQDFANPRNAAAGILRRLEQTKGLTDKLSFYAFDVTYPANKFATKVNCMQWLRAIGFETAIGKFCKTYEEVEAFIADIGNNPQPVPFDGCIVEYNGLDFAASLGETAHHENRHLAFKYTDECQETIFRGVEIATGRNGVASITAIFDPVDIDGTTVSRASLHNVDIFEALELGVGDTITVYKANQIIPQVKDNLARSGTYELPHVCPVCGANLSVIKEVNTRVLYCDNPACESKLLQKFVLFCSKDGMNIDGLGEAQLAIFMEQGWLDDFRSIYELYQYGAEMENLPGFGEQSVAKLLYAIDHSRNTDLAHVITALGIPGVGKTTAKLIAKYFNWNYIDFLTALRGNFNFTKIDTIGVNTMSEIYNWLRVQQNQWWLDDLAYKTTITKEFCFAVPEEPISGDSIFSGKTLCITGTFDMGSRSSIVAQVEKRGGKFAGSVSKKTDILLAGRDCGSKLAKAVECGVRIIEEEELKEILKA